MQRCWHALCLVMSLLRESLGRRTGACAPLLEQLAGQRLHSRLCAAVAFGLRYSGGGAFVVTKRRAVKAKCRRRRCLARAVLRRLGRRGGRHAALELGVGFAQKRSAGECALATQVSRRLLGARRLGLGDDLQLMERSLEVLVVLRAHRANQRRRQMLFKAHEQTSQRTSSTCASSSLTRCSAWSRSRSA
jgi:hypothetical protein